MKTGRWLLAALAAALVAPPAALMIAQQSGPVNARPQGPCDVYAAAQTPCVAAHSSTRALLAAYNGPLYQVMRQTDGKTLNIGVVQPNAVDKPTSTFGRGPGWPGGRGIGGPMRCCCLG